MDRYCIYLRKSRKDVEAELQGEGETLAAHRKALLSLAGKMKLCIQDIYEEVVSGDTIASRPKMQKLLSEVENGEWTGVLVMEVERLARGDTIDQGIVAQAFKYSNTKIITPIKTYDPNNEFDEEYFEFGLFMSRREYMTTKRRLIRGREAAARDGKFVGSIAPFGYERMKLPDEKGFTLRIVPEQAEIIRLIFRLYTTGVPGISDERVGIQKMATILNSMGIPACRYEYWIKYSIRDILTNPTYAGIIRWGWRKQKKKSVNGEMVISRPITNDECISVKGRHEPIVDSETFELAQKYMNEIPAAPVGYKKEVKNALAGLIICGKCGRKMVMRKSYSEKKKPYLVCHARYCETVSSPLPLVEARVLEALGEWVKQYKVSVEHPEKEETPALESTLKALEKEKATLSAQFENTFDLLEQGIYSKDIFLERSGRLQERIAATTNKIAEIEKSIQGASARENSKKSLVPAIESLMEAYSSLSTPADKNAALKGVIDHIVYNKSKSGQFKGGSADSFELTLLPNFPK